MAIAHPFKPSSLNIPHYKPNTLTQLEILVGFFVCVFVILVGTVFLSRRFAKRRLSTGQLLTVCWFTVCGFIHIILEGYFGLFNKTLAGSQCTLAQIWKEYAISDSRYVISDGMVVSIESFTAFVEGPFCFVTAVMYIRNNPWRYSVQLAVSLGQLYGTILYFVVEYLDGFQHGILWHPVYFWFYFVFMNIWWFIVPLILSVQSMRQLSSAQKLYDNKQIKPVALKNKKKK
ncbi:3-beta-hydroxysteroid-Delta(8),Delta(7)-isomerase-like [Tubulanus polymorphus]|uniref:3-beta-hydroxysteroid-Delta(8), Delta(7)-isomerase-like n=1 Tax=Tubulanus polymorphus TaxID=672921 RepID=UPI003DA370E0